MCKGSACFSGQLGISSSLAEPDISACGEDFFGKWSEFVQFNVDIFVEIDMAAFKVGCYLFLQVFEKVFIESCIWVVF